MHPGDGVFSRQLRFKCMADGNCSGAESLVIEYQEGLWANPLQLENSFKKSTEIATLTSFR